MLIGMYLGDGSIYEKENCDSIQTSLSLCKEKYERSIDILNKASSQLNSIHDWKLSTQYNNVYPLFTSSKEVATFIRKYVSGKYSQEKELNLTCLLQSSDFRKGILEGYYLTDGGNSNRIYTTSKNLVEQIEVLISSLGMNSVVDISDRTDEKVIIRGKEFNRNYPLYCIRYYSNGNKRSMGDVFKIFNNSIYFKIKSIEKNRRNS